MDIDVMIELDRYAESVRFNPETNELTFTMSDNGGTIVTAAYVTVARRGMVEKRARLQVSSQSGAINLCKK